MDLILVDLPDQIVTPRLILRAPRAGDGAAVNEAVIETAADLKKWMPWAQTLPTIDDSEANVREAVAKWILRKDLRVHVYEKESGRFLGGSGLHFINWAVPAFEIGFWLRKSAQGKGFVTETTNALTRFAFGHLGAKRVAICCDAKNLKSKAVAERLGFELEGRLKNHDVTADGELPRDTLVFARLDADGLPTLDVTW